MNGNTGVMGILKHPSTIWLAVGCTLLLAGFGTFVDPRKAKSNKLEQALTAIQLDDTQAIRDLLVDGLDPNHAIDDPVCSSLLLLSICRNVPRAFDALIDGGADPRATNKFGMNALMVAASQADTEFIRKLNESTWFDPNFIDATGRNALVYASRREEPEVIRVLVQAGARVNETNTQLRSSPLANAAMLGRLANVRVLLELGADPKSKDSIGETALDKAKREGMDLVVDYLEEWMATSK